MGAFGYSAGAHLVAMLALAGPDAGLEGDGPYRGYSSALQAAAMGGTPTDFNAREMAQADALRLFGGPPSSIRDRARRCSPVTYVRADAPPMLMLEGTADPISQADRLAKALTAAGAKNATLVHFEGADHNLLSSYLPIVRGAITAFFESTLGAERPNR